MKLHDIKQDIEKLIPGIDYSTFVGHMSIQRKSYKFKLEEMKEEIESDVKIGDFIQYVQGGRHNSDVVPRYSSTFQQHEIGNYTYILDIVEDTKGKLGYKVQCERGITYIRREAFKLVLNAPQPKEDLSYLIPLLKDLQ